MTQSPPSGGYLSTKNLHTVSALVEVGAGLSLILFPSMSMVFVAGTPLEGPAALSIGRVCGAALLALAVACWVARDDTQSRSSDGVVTAMLTYDVLAVVVLSYAGIGYQLQGAGLWPGVILHSLMTVWCVMCLQRRRIVS